MDKPFFRVVGFIDLPNKDKKTTKPQKLEIRDMDDVEEIQCNICGAWVWPTFYCSNCGTLHIEVLKAYIGESKIK